MQHLSEQLVWIHKLYKSISEVFAFFTVAT